MSNSVLAAQVRVRTWIDSAKNRLAETEAGQGAAEYAGVIVIAALIIVAIANAVTGAGIEDKVGAKIEEILNAGS